MNENNGRKTNSDEIRVIEEIVEGYWICPNCNAKNSGSMQKCAACGAIRSENVKFFCDDDAPVITDEEALRKAKAGPDWICPFCSNTSPADAKNCTGCGSARSAGKNRDVKNIPAGGSPAAENIPNKPVVPSKPLPAGLKIGCGVIMLLFLIVTFLSCQEKSGRIEITDTSWVRVIERLEYKTVQEQAWQNEVPAAAVRLSSAREVRSHKEIPDGFENVTETYTEKVQVGEKKVQDGKKDLGNGRFEIKYKMVPEYREEKRTRQVRKQKFRKEPIYDEKVTYNIDRWMDIQLVEAKGTVEEPVWPDAGIKGSAVPQIGDIKEKARSETYLVKAKRDGAGEEFEIKTLRNVPVSHEQFMKLRKGSKWEAIFSGLGDLREIKFTP